MSHRLKQTQLKLLHGGASEPSSPRPPEQPKGTSRREYFVLFAVAGIIGLAIGYWIWTWLFRRADALWSKLESRSLAFAHRMLWNFGDMGAEEAELLKFWALAN